jgi:hypothetical protein
MNIMPKTLLLILSSLLMLACSSPKYTYNFDYYDYNSGKRAPEIKPSEKISPFILNDDVLMADASATIILKESASPTVSGEKEKAPTVKKYSDMNRGEKKAFRAEVKKEFKSYVNSVKKGDTVKAETETKVMDNDLKLAIIFGAVGLTLTLFGGINEAFWVVGVISIVVGVVFLIKWLVRQ